MTKEYSYFANSVYYHFEREFVLLSFRIVRDKVNYVDIFHSSFPLRVGKYEIENDSFRYK